MVLGSAHSVIARAEPFRQQPAVSSVPCPPEQRPAIQGHHRQRGGALLEFAIVLPVLMMLLFGVWEFGRIFDAWLISTNAAREGARYAVATADDSTVTNKVNTYLASSYGRRLKSVDPAGDVATTVAVSHPADGQARIVVTAAVDIWAPAVAPLMSGNTFTVTAWSTMHQ